MGDLSRIMTTADKFKLMERAKKNIIDKLKNDFRTNRHSKDDYDYENTIRDVLSSFSVTNNFSIHYTINRKDKYSAEILMYGHAVNDRFDFGGRRWVRERKLKDLL